MREEKKKYLEAGMDAVVAKPIDFGKLFSTMEAILPEGVGEAVPKEPIELSIQAKSELPLIDGVDIEKGIQTWQDSEAYAKALLEFSREYGNAADELTRLIDEGEIESAFRIAHALKGVAGNLWVAKVADAAGEIDTLLREKRVDVIKDRLSKLAVALNRAVESIRQVASVQTSKKVPKKELDIPHLTTLLVEMMSTFDQFNPYSIEPILSELNGYLSRDQLNPIVEHIERFDFDGAKRETLNLAKILKIDLEE
jgi:HPt (histidine-containing phosphotransfer) domain-containing protein